jgi:hypothetical protein
MSLYLINGRHSSLNSGSNVLYEYQEVKNGFPVFHAWSANSRSLNRLACCTAKPR